MNRLYLPRLIAVGALILETLISSCAPLPDSAGNMTATAPISGTPQLYTLTPGAPAAGEPNYTGQVRICGFENRLEDITVSQAAGAWGMEIDACFGLKGDESHSGCTSCTVNTTGYLGRLKQKQGTWVYDDITAEVAQVVVAGGSDKYSNACQCPAFDPLNPVNSYLLVPDGQNTGQEGLTLPTLAPTLEIQNTPVPQAYDTPLPGSAPSPTVDIPW